MQLEVTKDVHFIKDAVFYYTRILWTYWCMERWGIGSREYLTMHTSVLSVSSCLPKTNWYFCLAFPLQGYGLQLWISVIQVILNKHQINSACLETNKVKCRSACSFLQPIKWSRSCSIFLHKEWTSSYIWVSEGVTSLAFMLLFSNLSCYDSIV